MVDGFVAVDKPSGWTSHDVVARARRALSTRKVGHAGTLDPMATGVLVLGVGRATRLLRFVTDLPKTYVATALFGVATDTLDAEGAVLSREPMTVTATELEAVVPRFVGEIMQVPPMVSALKVGGRRLYELAREGVEVDRPSRPVTIYELTIDDVTPGPFPEVSFTVVCGSGTYIRALADDLAAAFGGHAHLTGLRRTAIGTFSAESAVDVESMEHVIPMADGLAHLPAVTADEATARGVRNGVQFTALSDAAGPIRVLDEQGALLAVYENGPVGAKPVVVFS